MEEEKNIMKMDKFKYEVEYLNGRRHEKEKEYNENSELEYKHLNGNKKCQIF